MPYIDSQKQSAKISAKSDISSSITNLNYAMDKCADLIFALCQGVFDDQSRTSGVDQAKMSAKQARTRMEEAMNKLRVAASVIESLDTSAPEEEEQDNGWY